MAPATLPPCHRATVPHKATCNGSAHFVALLLRFSLPISNGCQSLQPEISLLSSFSIPIEFEGEKVSSFVVGSTCNLFDYLRLVFNLFRMFLVVSLMFCLSHL